jgi:hypothetical protein
LLNRYTVISRIVGSNPIPSATTLGFLRSFRPSGEPAYKWVYNSLWLSAPRPCYLRRMPPRSRKLTLEDLTTARRLYERDGLTYRALADQFGVAMSTIRTLLVAVGVTSRPEGFQRQPQPQPAPAPPPRPTVEIVPDVSGRLRIPMRTPRERRLRRWTAPELAALAVEIASGRVMHAPRGRLGLPERQTRQNWQAAGIALVMAMRRLRAA